MNKNRKAISIVIAISMIMPSIASMVEATTVNWLSPMPGESVSGQNVEVSVGYNTQSSVKVTRIELYIDGRLYDTKQMIRPESRGICSMQWNTARYANGPHAMVVRLYSGMELISEVSSTGTVGASDFDLAPPVVKFVGVKSGDVIKGVKDIEISAKDNSGDPPMVSLLVDNSLKLLKNRPPYIYPLDTTTYTNGKHELETYAYDNAGNKSNPVTLNVSFMNKANMPVVTSVSVGPSSGPAASEDDGVNITTKESAEKAPAPSVAKRPKVAAPASANTPKIRSDKASPAATKPTVATSPATAASPGKAQTSVKQVAAKAGLSVAAPALLVKSVDTPAIKQTNTIPAEITAKAHSLATKPIEIISTPPAELAPVDNSTKTVESGTPATRSENITPVSTHGVAVEPLSTADSAAPAKPIMIAKAPEMRGADMSGLMSSHTFRAQEALSEAKSVDVARATATDVPSAKLRPVKQSGCASVGKRVAMAPPISKKFKVISAPFVNDVTARNKVKTTIKTIQTEKLENAAKLEKKFIPISGKVKLRDLVNHLGGVVFWDQDTHTVTAYAGDMKMELKIGSNKALVNGKQMHISHIPYIAKGRTIIDAQVYHQALAFVSQMHVAKVSD